MERYSKSFEIKVKLYVRICAIENSNTNVSTPALSHLVYYYYYYYFVTVVLFVLLMADASLTLWRRNFLLNFTTSCI